MLIRAEEPDDKAAIRTLIRDAFATAQHSSGTEWAIVDELRRARALTLSLVALDGRAIVGHVAISPVGIAGASGWFGLGPVAVAPERQGGGVGAALIREALMRLRTERAAGCVVLGEPSYYGRFGFRHYPGLTYGEVPPPYFQAVSFAGDVPEGAVDYHPAFRAES